MLGELAPAMKHLFPKLEALAFSQVETRRGAEVSLQKLASRRNIHAVERVSEKLEVGVFNGQARGR